MLQLILNGGSSSLLSIKFAVALQSRGRLVSQAIERVLPVFVQEQRNRALNSVGRS